MVTRKKSTARHPHENGLLTDEESRELRELGDRFPLTYESCVENAQDMGFEPWSLKESLEVLRQLRGLAEAGEAS